MSCEDLWKEAKEHPHWLLARASLPKRVLDHEGVKEHVLPGGQLGAVIAKASSDVARLGEQQATDCPELASLVNVSLDGSMEQLSSPQSCLGLRTSCDLALVNQKSDHASDIGKFSGATKSL